MRTRRMDSGSTRGFGTRRRFHLMGVAAALILAPWWGGAAFGAQPTDGLEEIKDVTIVVAQEPYSGSLIPPPTEAEFRFRWAETGDVLTFRWSTLEEPERKRVQKLFGIEVDAGGTRLLWGDPLKCARFRLASTKKFVEGLEVPERALQGFRCLKTATQLVQIPAGDVESEEVIEKRECDIYSPEEGYERLVARKPPALDSAGDHLELARQCATMGLYAVSIDHLEMAKTVDPRTEERTKDFRAELVVKHEEQAATDLYYRILTLVNRQDYGSALEKSTTFLRNYPNSERRTKVESMLPEITEKSQIDQTKQVIFMYYTLANDLLQLRMAKKTKVDEKGRPVPAIPGKQVTTKQDRILRGKLKSDTPEMVELQVDDLTIQVPRKDILTLTDVDLSKGARLVDPTFAELKAYVSDANGGLGKDIVAHICETLKLPEDKIRETFEGRFKQTAVYKEGELVKTPLYVTVHTANYGKGSWLREDAGGGGVGGQPKIQGRNRQRQNGGGGAGGNNQNQNQQVVDPDDSDDPEIWWKVQHGETRYQILRAISGEKFFKLKELRGKVCPECSGTGIIRMWSGNSDSVPCPVCRGLKVLTQVLYW